MRNNGREEKKKKLPWTETLYSVTIPNNVNGSNNTPAVTAFCCCCCCFCLPSLRSTQIEPQQQPRIIIMTIIVVVVTTSPTVSQTTTARTLCCSDRTSISLSATSAAFPRDMPCPVSIKAEFRFVHPERNQDSRPSTASVLCRSHVSLIGTNRIF